MRGSEQEIWKYLHRMHGYSVDHALTHEGYRISPEELTENARRRQHPYKATAAHVSTIERRAALTRNAETQDIWIGVGRDGGPYEVHPSHGAFAIVNSENGHVRTQTTDRDDAIHMARELNRGLSPRRGHARNAVRPLQGKPKSKYPTIKALKPLGDWDPAGEEYWTEKIWETMYGAAGGKEKLTQAWDRVHADGWSGPIDNDEWEETEGYRMTVTDGRRILADASDALNEIGRIEFTNPDYGDYEEDEEGNALPNAYIDDDAIRDDLFKWYREIYGGNP